ncbi:hypothetical protein A2642_01850 [Candidatus Nomurabacteria bacterium RIFCSPHIGHO2_01_FULL_39_10]|uniref:Uncharacterized protein n=1 Tax=Candidatus Nomurabacteria bacterium RIFCSPHIGHO2_01_FULL_39_10 TaxID=1801733 RepID=A0A1F6V4N4_9BACT|nr:MAG: hypothetical protein A2642_01850 [Candidatus Nomurabacteria bacterium RIFCSPHIGHO2_01_FULL_39_10]
MTETQPANHLEQLVKTDYRKYIAGTIGGLTVVAGGTYLLGECSGKDSLHSLPYFLGGAIAWVTGLNMLEYSAAKYLKK